MCMNMEFNIKQAIINRLRSTNRENIEVVINYMENTGFFTAQCEPHHTYKGGDWLLTLGRPIRLL